MQTGMPTWGKLREHPQGAMGAPVAPRASCAPRRAELRASAPIYD
jgi:hypothetical protein